MNIGEFLRFSFSMAVPASDGIYEKIANSVLVHRTKLKYLPKIITKIHGRPDTHANCDVDLTGNFGYDPIELLRATLRDCRTVDFEVFSDPTGKGFTSYTYFFLGEPSQSQIAAQNLRGDGESATITVQGKDLLSDPRRRIFYRTGLFWEADKAVVVKGGYEGPAHVDPMLANSNASVG